MGAAEGREEREREREGEREEREAGVSTVYKVLVVTSPLDPVNVVTLVPIVLVLYPPSIEK